MKRQHHLKRKGILIVRSENYTRDSPIETFNVVDCIAASDMTFHMVVSKIAASFQEMRVRVFL